jgi:gas vesicle protein
MKRAFYIGVILGGILGVAVALSMDILLGKSLGGG